MQDQKKNAPLKFTIELFTIWTVVFVVLKLLKILRIPWLWVLSPVWIPAMYAVLMVIFVVIAAALAALFQRK